MVVAGAAATYVVVDRNRDDTSAEADAGIDPADVLTDDQLEAIHGTTPDPGCDAEPARAPDDASLVPLDVLRVDGSCLTASTEYLPADEVDTRRAELADDSTVIAATVTPPTYLDEADDKRGKQWPLDLLGVPDDSSELPWPDAPGVVVAVIDSGIDAGHPDLADAVVARKHYAGEGDLDPHGHGTHVAGIIAARAGNGGIVGVAPGVSILDVPVKLGDTNAQAESWMVGLPWAVNHGADVVNMSIGAALSTYEETEGALEYAVAVAEFAATHDVVLVASAGNCGATDEPVEECLARDQRQIPTVLRPVVAVGSVQSDSELPDYTTKNDDVDLVAPGGGDLLKPGEVLSTSPGGKYERKHGTSQAAPHVAAAAAIGRFVAPDATAAEVSQALVDTADLDEVAEGDRDDVGAGRGLLDIPGMIDQLRGGSSDPPSPPDPSYVTQAAFVQDGQLFAFDGEISHPVRRVDPESPPHWIDWSADHSLLVGADDQTLFSWAGPDTEVVEKPCDWCADEYSDPAFVSDVAVTDPGEGEPSGDLVLRIDVDGTLTRYDAHTLEEIGSAMPAFPDDAVGTKTLHGSVGGKLIVHESGGAQASERLWLVDPVSGEVGPSHDVAGSMQADLAVSASADRIAAVTGYSDCLNDNGAYVLNGGDLTEIAHPAQPADTIIKNLFFNGDVLYAFMAGVEWVEGEPCREIAQAGLWRLDGDTWNQLDPYASAGRPLEDRTGGEPTGWLVVRDGEGVFEPPMSDDPQNGTLGDVGDHVWSTPTRTEVPPAPVSVDCTDITVDEPDAAEFTDITAAGTECAEVERLVRELATLAPDDPPEALGFVCTTNGLPVAYRCTREEVVVTFVKQ